ncbi:hypothetical protein [Streptomyces sp. NPDC002889]|uniref:hypothetical protein n=1 Tax=Streptomyces sp. NPDC002889 TaxID=3364669 RepID=UPI00369CD80A
MERHLLEKLLAGDDEASVVALASLRSGATYSVGDRAHPAERHAGVFGHRFGACGCTESNLLGWNEQCSSSANMAGRCA